MRPELFFWIAAFLAFGVLEAATVSLVSIWFMGGALLACLRPFMKKYVDPRRTRTNADRILGKEGIVTETIDNLQGTGTVKVDGVEWTARSQEEQVIEKGAVVRILKIEGVKIFVEPAKTPAGKEG